MKKTCKKCNYENAEESLYCQHCGNVLKERTRLLKKNDDYNPLYGMGTRGSSLAPLGGMAIEQQGKEFADYKKNKTFPKNSIEPLSDGTWYCPLCGDKNRGKLCKGCGFSYS